MWLAISTKTNVLVNKIEALLSYHFLVTETNMSNSTADESDSTGTTIGITVGGTVLLIAIVAIFLCLIQLRRRRLNKMAS